MAYSLKVSIVINSIMAALLNPAKSGIDISNARDLNADGTILINYYDTTDRNNSLADLIEDRIDRIIYSFEDDDNDGDDD